MTGKPTPPRLGRLLVERGFITEQELELALARSAETGNHLGDTLLELDLVPPSEIEELLAVQRAWRPLGWMLVERGLLSEEQLAECLDESERTGRRLGEIVRARGLVTNHALEAVVHEQYELEIELERGFGNGLREEIERRYREKRHQPVDDARDPDPFAQLWALTAPTTASPPAPQGEDTGDEAGEIRRLREALAERDATIAALRQRLGEADTVSV